MRTTKFYYNKEEIREAWMGATITDLPNRRFGYVW